MGSTSPSWRCAGARSRPSASTSTPYPAAVRAAILAVSDTTTTTAAISRLHFQLPELYARAVLRAVQRFGPVELIGCHGQTVYHEGGRNTLQLGEPAVLAERTGVPVVSDFRARDIAAGGQGAPLVPFADYLLFRHARRKRIALNIGGIANITVIPAAARAEEVVAFDTGPGNMVIDALAREYTGGKCNYDRGGRIAASGTVQTRLLDELLRDPYYRRPAPKSAGREQYGVEYRGTHETLGCCATGPDRHGHRAHRRDDRDGNRPRGPEHGPDRVRGRSPQPADHGAPGGVSAGGGHLHIDRSWNRRRTPKRPLPSPSWRTKHGAANPPTCLPLPARAVRESWEALLGSRGRRQPPKIDGLSHYLLADAHVVPVIGELFSAVQTNNISGVLVASRCLGERGSLVRTPKHCIKYRLKHVGLPSIRLDTQGRILVSISRKWEYWKRYDGLQFCGD